MSNGVKFFIIAILIVLLSSCVRTEVEEIHWTTESVPMVFSVISPGHPVELYLGKSNFTKNVLNPIPYPEAKVFICGQDSSWKELTIHSADVSIYVDINKLMQIENGSTYYLRIELKDKTLHSQTTVPIDGATIADVRCTISAGTVPSNGKKCCRLNGKLNLPQNKDYGYYLSAFSEEIGYAGTLSSGVYQDIEFLCPTDIDSFALNLITVDPYFKKFRLSETINSGQGFDSDFITVITSAFGGVLPSYSNIENGMGLFGSFITDSRLVTVNN